MHAGKAGRAQQDDNKPANSSARVLAGTLESYTHMPLPSDMGEQQAKMVTKGVFFLMEVSYAKQTFSGLPTPYDDETLALN
jgi:hypothetical protein